MFSGFRKLVRRSLKKLFITAGAYDGIRESTSRQERNVHVLTNWYRTYSDVEPRYQIIVFSKDRPMQLHALLSSYLALARTLARVTVLYHASGQDFFRGYDECMRIFAGNRNVQFYKQAESSSFYQDLLLFIDRGTESRIVFLVDDIVFVREFDLHDFDEFDLRTHVPSLRLGRNIEYSYTTGTPEALPATLLQRGNFLLWDWKDNDIDWSYPLSLDGNIFLRSEIRVLLRQLKFGSPNTLEEQMQSCIELYACRRGICYELPRVVNIPCNKVQSDVDNRHGNVSAEFLLSKWLEGYQIVVEGLREVKSDSVHLDAPFQLGKR